MRRSTPIALAVWLLAASSLTAQAPPPVPDSLVKDTVPRDSVFVRVGERLIGVFPLWAIEPPKTPKKDPSGDLLIRGENSPKRPGDYTYLGSGYAGEYLANPALVTVKLTTGNCEDIRVQWELPYADQTPKLYTAIVDREISIDRVTRSDSIAEANARTSEETLCFGHFDWRLGEKPGRNRLIARVISATGGAVLKDFTPALFHAVGKARAGFVLAGAYVRDPASAFDSDADSAAIDDLEDRWQPVIGADFPVIIGAGWFQEWILDSMRFTVGTSGQQLFGDLYVGLSVAPFVTHWIDAMRDGPSGLAAAVAGKPFQVSTGYRWGIDFTDGSYVVIVQYNTNNVLGPLIGGLFKGDS